MLTSICNRIIKYTEMNYLDKLDKRIKRLEFLVGLLLGVSGGFLLIFIFELFII